MSDKSTPVVETGIAIGALCIERSVALRAGKDTVAFRVAIDSTSDTATLDQLMDTISHVADRERLKATLVEREEARDAQKDQPQMAEKEIARLKRERATLLASYKAGHAASRKRLDFQVTPHQQAELDKYDKAVEAVLSSVKTFLRDQPITEWEIACLRARIAGKPQPEPPPELAAAISDIALSEAAE